MDAMFWDNLNTLKNAYTEMTDEICDKFQIARAEADIILYLSKNTKQDTATDIVGYTGYSKSNVSTAVRKLELAGYLETICTPDNRRVVHLKLLEKADPIVKFAEKKQRAFEKRLRTEFSKDELKLMEALLGRASKNLRNEDHRHDEI